MNHAEHLLDMAKNHLIAGNEHTADALLAGANALNTVAEQAETIETLSRLLAEAEEAAIERTAQIERVRDTYGHAHTLITEALEGDT